MTSDTNYPWVEEFRPIALKDVIGAEPLVNKLTEFINSKSIPNLLFLGPPGTGKTTVAKILANQIAGEDAYIYINASDERGMDTIRSKVQDFCAVASFSDLKIIILDEADGLTIDAQKVLRAVTEQYAKTCRFILTANYESKLIDPVKSRFQIFNLEKASQRNICIRCLQILKAKNVNITVVTEEEKKEALEKNVPINKVDTKTEITRLVKYYYPDIRSVINNLQRGTINSVFTFSNNTDSKKTYDNLVTFVAEKRIKDIREQILSTTTDYDSLYDVLYERIKEITNDNDKARDIILYLAEYQYRNSTHANRELNFIACLLEITKVI